MDNELAHLPAKQPSKNKLSHNNLVLSTIVLISLFVSFLTCYFSTPTIFGGRDQGAIATAAIRLAENKSFAFEAPASQELFQKYGPGKALNFPGFDYQKDGKLTTRFPKAFIAYLAALYALFGLFGIQYAYFIPLALFFVFFWLILKNLFSEKYALIGFLLAVTFFSFLWFSKYALTEIFMLFSVWGGIFFLLAYLKDRNKRYFCFSFAFFALSALTRIEGMLFFLLAFAYLLILERKKVVFISKNIKKSLLVFSVLVFALFLLLNFSTLFDSVKNIAKLFLPQFAKVSAPSSNLYFRLLSLFTSYNLLAYLFLGIAGIIVSLKKFRSFENFRIAPLFILFPSLFYLASPAISLDDPWIFRRYTFSVFPLLIIFALFLLEKVIKNNVLRYIAFSALLLSNLAISFHFFAYSENKDLLPQIKNLSENFEDTDLILIDRLATGSGWSLASEPMASLFSKQAVYFFNADDLKYLSREKYKNIFLVAPLDQKGAWYDNIEKDLEGKITIRNNFLEPSRGLFFLAKDQKETISNGIWKLK